MIRLFQIEWIKTRSNLSTWALLVLYGIGVYVVCSIGTILLNATINTYSSEGPVEAPIINLYEFPGIWHNLTYLASYLRAFLGIMIIVSIANEISYKTLRQNIIDGFSPSEFLISKIYQIFGLAIVSSLLIFGLIYYFGFQYAEKVTPEVVYDKINFVGAFFIQMLTFMSFSMFVAFLFRSTGLSIVFAIAYSFFIETVLRWIFLDSEGIIASLLPINAMDNLIRAPFNLIDPESVQTQVETTPIFIALVWFVSFMILSWVILKKRDL